MSNYKNCRDITDRNCKDEKLCSYLYSRSVEYLFTEFSLLTVTAISVDCYLALRLHLHYRELVTVKRVLMALATIWTMDFLTHVLYLTIVNVLFLTFSVVLYVLCIVVMIWCYFKIFQTIRRHQDHIGAQIVI